VTLGAQPALPALIVSTRAELILVSFPSRPSPISPSHLRPVRRSPHLCDPHAAPGSSSTTLAVPCASPLLLLGHPPRLGPLRHATHRPVL